MEKIFQKWGENKNKLRKAYPKNHENFKNSKPRVQFCWFFLKKECIRFLLFRLKTIEVIKMVI